jgi:6-phosphogluconolactonase (cycloisomerase 2 family)
LATSLYFTIPKIDRLYDTDEGFNIIEEEYPDNVIGSVVYVKSTNRFLYTYNRYDYYT